MKENQQTDLPDKQNASGQAQRQNEENEVLNLNELFDVQGGIEASDVPDNTLKECGLGCFGGSGGILNGEDPTGHA